MRFVRPLLVLTVMSVLAGCGSAANLFSSGNPEYDGLWTGRLQFTFGQPSCPRTGALRAEIRQGVMTASVRWPNIRGEMDGVIDEAGVLQSSDILQNGFDFAEATGQFSDRTAEGTFSGKKCRGVWTLQKVRNL